MSKHKYLIDNKIPHGIYQPENGDHRIPDWKEQRKVYGFDERETWNLRDLSLGWMYEHIKMYIDKCDVNLDYAKFNYKDETLTQREVLDRICKDIELYFYAKYSFDPNEWGKRVPYLNEIGTLWGLVLPAMWW